MARKRSSQRQPELVNKQVLAKAIAQILEDRGLAQREAAYIIRDAPSQISLMVSGKLKGFSAERLLRTLARLGRDVEVRIRKAAGRTGKVRIMIR